ncbi:16S rRNA (guanine(966)-N(2))-methyltransferase RsmD [Hirschia baltica]|uniref:Methyltransferase n=1 Tax=Hirschia baltica (strain ATCC 49814 / DSM 5838 / IFAM 1418) TaxID=582402 RepID=C6XQS9_HIRBI|nr:16S rRNA (guanine(966)-N(2))-methyltransferase RsmD [Hirschia baltica]ACT58685.1 methyltransferase [Hirschia baltica ATCC 49814]
MRIVSGKLKGRSIITPEGRDTRPTSDRAREAMFNILAHAAWAPPIEDARVIDLYAGSGALGFEALSRGASYCLFVETHVKARGVIRENIEKFQQFGTTRIHRRSAVDLGKRPAGAGEKFDIAFMDPPYGYELVDPAITELVKGDWLADDAIIVAEVSKDDPEPKFPGFEVLHEKSYGAARVYMARVIKPDDEETSIPKEDTTQNE